eukprot:15526113-Heterocapsa_arctica.AAC.1
MSSRPRCRHTASVVVATVAAYSAVVVRWMMFLPSYRNHSTPSSSASLQGPHSLPSMCCRTCHTPFRGVAA